MNVEYKYQWIVRETFKIDKSSDLQSSSIVQNF